MSKGYSLEGNTIVIDRELTELDVFVKDFLSILKKYSDYLIVSGFVSICSGRARGTEDVDVIVPIMEKNIFEKLFNELEEKKFWCYQGNDVNKVYSYVKNLVSIRFARLNEMFPNMEFVPFDESKKLKVFEFYNPQQIRVKDFEFKIPPIEFEILYKEKILKGNKDLADARHLRTFFSEIISKEKLKEYGNIIDSEVVA